MTKEKSRAGGLFLAGIGLAVALVGGVFAWLMWSSYAQSQLTREWQKTPCEVTVSGYNTRSAEHISKEYSWKLEYQYSIDGEDYTSKFYTPRGAKWTSARDRIEALMDQYPVGTETVCFVNLENPEQAILKHDSQAPLYSIWFPLLFVVGGLGIMWSGLRAMKLIPC